LAEYVTRSGDMWDLIAFEQLGSCSYVNLLIEANESLSDVAIFSAGVTLALPDVSGVAAAEHLPPWRKRNAG